MQKLQFLKLTVYDKLLRHIYGGDNKTQKSG